jgi:hypothetical protein
MTRLRALTYVSVVISALILFFDRGARTTVPDKGATVDHSWLVNQGNPLTPAADIRPPDQTFLTYPEWFLVFGPGEQADFFQNHTATKFPFMSHVYQIWESYAVVYDVTRGNFKFNTGYHVMIMVIATSSTVEFGLKAIYETMIGRLTDTRANEKLTEEDQFNAKFARDYVDFLATAPWYEFDFKSRLGHLWTDTSLFGPHPLRKLERKYFLTTELAVKTVYGWLIKLGTRSAYDVPKLTTVVVIDHLPSGVKERVPDLNVLKELPDGSAIVSLPRYAPFSTNASTLAANGVGFKEVAGNTSAMLITLLAPRTWDAGSTNFKVIFTQPIPTRPGLNRIALVTPVNLLSPALRQLQESKTTIEHIYDF